MTRRLTCQRLTATGTTEDLPNLWCKDYGSMKPSTTEDCNADSPCERKYIRNTFYMLLHGRTFAIPSSKPILDTQKYVNKTNGLRSGFYCQSSLDQSLFVCGMWSILSLFKCRHDITSLALCMVARKKQRLCLQQVIFVCVNLSLTLVIKITTGTAYIT